MEQHSIATAALRIVCGLPTAVRALMLLSVAMSPAAAAAGGEASSAAGGGEAAFRRVHLRCGADHMAVAVEAAPGFEGVVYTRGSFHERRPPCFLSARHAKQATARSGHLTLRFPLDACHTKRDADTYSNVVVVQADEELVMPGDAAFALQCDFSRPRDVTVGADLSAASHRTNVVASRISMVEADPAAEALGRRRRRNAPAAANASDEVELTATTVAGGDDDDDDFEDFEDDVPVAVPSKDEL